MNLNGIVQLIFRDFRAYRVQILLWSLFGFVIGMFVIFANTHQVRMFTGSSNTIFIASMWPFIMEIKNKNNWLHTVSLPVRRADVVISRFITSLIIAFINLGIWFASFKILQSWLTPESTYVVGMEVVLFVAFNLMMNLAFFYFVFFRFNFITAIALYFILMLTPTLLRTILPKGAIPTSDMIIEDTNLFMVGIAIASALFLVSFFTSLMHFRKKDL